MRNVHARISVLFRASSVCLHNTSYRAPCSRIHSDNCSTRTRTLSFVNTIARRLHSAASKRRFHCWPSRRPCSAASAVDSMKHSTHYVQASQKAHYIRYVHYSQCMHYVTYVHYICYPLCVDYIPYSTYMPPLQQNCEVV